MNRLDAIEACNRVTVIEPAIVGTHSAGMHRARMDATCPTHGSGECVETFYAQSMLAGLSLWDLWTLWRPWRRRGGR